MKFLLDGEMCMVLSAPWQMLASVSVPGAQSMLLNPVAHSSQWVPAVLCWHIHPAYTYVCACDVDGENVSKLIPVVVRKLHKTQDFYAYFNIFFTVLVQTL